MPSRTEERAQETERGGAHSARASSVLQSVFGFPNTRLSRRLIPTRTGEVLEAQKTMACRSCGSKNVTKFVAEMTVHILGLENVDKPTVLVFPSPLVCMDCGFTELKMVDNELRLLGKILLVILGLPDNSIKPGMRRVSVEPQRR